MFITHNITYSLNIAVYVYMIHTYFYNCAILHALQACTFQVNKNIRTKTRAHLQLDYISNRFRIKSNFMHILHFANRHNNCLATTSTHTATFVLGSVGDDCGNHTSGTHSISYIMGSLHNWCIRNFVIGQIVYLTLIGPSLKWYLIFSVLEDPARRCYESSWILNEIKMKVLKFGCWVFLSLVGSVLSFNGENFELECPDECDCHYFRINWVTDCSESNLTDIPYRELSSNVYILDMNGNNIETLRTFPKNIKLRRLQMAHNRLAEIKKEQFQGLEYLIDIDLSENKIIKIDPDTFQ